MPFPDRALANPVPWSRAGQFPFLERELANSNPWSRAGWRCSLVASCHPRSPTLRWLIPVPGRKLAGAVPWSEAAQFLIPENEITDSCSPSPSWPMPFPGHTLANSCSLSPRWLIPVPWSQRWLVAHEDRWLSLTQIEILIRRDSHVIIL